MICAIIQARMSSTRLPGKVLKPVLGRPLLAHMLERVSRAHTLHKIAVATTVSSVDTEIVSACEQSGFVCFRGSEDDVLDRYYQTAREFGAEVIVRLTSDCPLMDPVVVDHVVSIFLDGQYDYVSNTAPLPSTWPDGMDVEVFPFPALERAWREAVKPSDREHVTFYLWNNPDKFHVYRVEHDPDWSEYRLTVDYPQDLELVNAVFEALYPSNPAFTLEEIVAFLEAKPRVKKLNQGIIRNIGWQTAFKKDRLAGFGGGSQ
jgi:spore coat polysaccharide biosynthesis protein SpsF